MREYGLNAVDRRFEVDQHHLVDVVVSDFRRHPRNATTSIIEPHVDATKARHRCFEYAAHVIAFGNISDDDFDIGTALRRDRGELRLSPGHQHELGSLATCELCERCSDARTRSRDDDDFVLHELRSTAREAQCQRARERR